MLQKVPIPSGLFSGSVLLFVQASQQVKNFPSCNLQERVVSICPTLWSPSSFIGMLHTKGLNAVATQQGLLYMHHLAGKDSLIKKKPHIMAACNWDLWYAGYSNTSTWSNSLVFVLWHCCPGHKTKQKIELISWQVDLVRVDHVKVDLVRVDLMAITLQPHTTT